MQRAALVIGVNRTGNLPALQAAVSSARLVEQWARAQAFDQVIALYDDNAPVTVRDIKTAIKRIIEPGVVEQLLIYFSGHGVNLRYSEYWLLSGAPDDTQEAVNVDGSVVLARRAGVSHVALISDACRTAAEGIQAQFVTGSEIFPNTGGGGAERPVDLFFATTLGAPSLEVKTPNDAVARFKALYTEALVDALSGLAPQCLEDIVEASGPFQVVRPWPLRQYLETEVPRRLVRAAVPLTVFQTPDARITSPPATWLSRLQKPAAQAAGAPSDEPPSPGLESLTHDRATIPGSRPEQAEAISRSAREMLANEARERAQPFGRTHFETRCGFKLRGTTFRSCFAASDRVHVAEPDSVRADVPGPASVVLRFEDGTGAILPAIPDFICGLTVKDGELVDVIYEPSDTSWRWSEFQRRLSEVRALRAQIAAAARFGVFRLEGHNAAAVAAQMQVIKGIDPTMAIYAAYAYNGLQQLDRIKEMEMYLWQDLNLRFFDIALLAGELSGSTLGAGVFPPVPMLSQGWALLRAYGVQLPAALGGLPRCLASSFWTLFDSTGVDDLERALRHGEIQ